MTLTNLTTLKRRKGEKKSRSFTVQLLGFLNADSLWDSPDRQDEAIAPILMAYVGTPQELQPFTANLRGGRPAKTYRDKLQLPKKAGYKWITTKVSTDSVTLVYLPQLFHLEPQGLNGSIHKFVFAPPTWWLDSQVPELEQEFGERARDAARAALFSAFLDRRSSMPILGDLRFQLQLLDAALDCGFVHTFGNNSYTDLFWTRSYGRWGFENPLAVDATDFQIQYFLNQETRRFYEREIRNGQTRRPTTRRVLSYPQSAPQQLCFDFGLARTA